jgi:hypothetical protein
MQNNYSISNTNNIINHNTLLVKNGIKNNPKTTVSNSRAHTTNKQQPTPPSKPPPPTLPKPKFILPPQTSATNLLLQRNLKSKSELNIAASNASVTTTTTTANTVSSSGNTMNSNSSSSPSSSTSSTCSSSSTSKPCQQEMLMTTTTNQKQTIENGMPLNFPQPPLRNKILENSSLVSSSQGYHSDTWESSHSSRQSFDMDSQPPTSTSSFVNTNNTQFNLNRFKQFNKISSKLASESKIAKTTSLNQQNESSSSHSCSSSSSSSSSANAIGSSSSDGSINGGIASGSDDTDSSLPPSQKVFSKTPTKAATNSTPNMNCGIELPIYYQTSAKTFNSNNEEVISNYSTLLKSGQTNDEIVTATNNNNSSYSELYEIY